MIDTITCPKCNVHLRAPLDSTEATVKCQRCGHEWNTSEDAPLEADADVEISWGLDSLERSLNERKTHRGVQSKKLGNELQSDGSLTLSEATNSLFDALHSSWLISELITKCPEMKIATIFSVLSELEAKGAISTKVTKYGGVVTLVKGVHALKDVIRTLLSTKGFKDCVVSDCAIGPGDRVCPQDGFDTAYIDAFVVQAEIGDVAEPMAGLGVSSASLSICDGTWPDGPDTKKEDYLLGLAHGKGLVIGRQEGGGTEYLDPRFRPTQRIPGTYQRIVVDAQRHSDTFVSRGHFTLIGSPIGIIFVNGVPRRGGGTRPPVNWTQLIQPECRLMLPGERFVIAPGVVIKIRLPNMMDVVIAAA